MLPSKVTMRIRAVLRPHVIGGPDPDAELHTRLPVNVVAGVNGPAC